MKPGEIVLTRLAQADGQSKLRPTLVICSLPPYGDLLVAGVSSQLQQQVPGFDELIDRTAPDFPRSGLTVPSIVRLGFLAVIPLVMIKGRLGSLSEARFIDIRQRLIRHIQSGSV